MAKNKNPDDLPTVTITDEMKSGIYALKTTINQEKAVGDTLAYKAKKHKVGVVAVLSPPELRGYVLIEAFDRDALEKLIKGVPHARGLVAGETALTEVEHFLTPKPAVAGRLGREEVLDLREGHLARDESARVGHALDELLQRVAVERLDEDVAAKLGRREHGDDADLVLLRLVSQRVAD